MSFHEIIECVEYDGMAVSHIENSSHITCDPLFMPPLTLGLTYAERLYYEEVYLNEFQCRYCKVKCMGEDERDEHESEHKYTEWVFEQFNPIEIQLVRDHYELD